MAHCGADHDRTRSKLSALRKASGEVTKLGKLTDIKGIRGATYRLGQLMDRTAFAVNGVANLAKVRWNGHDSKPSVSVVVVGRNDDYMPDFKERLQATIEWNRRYLASE